MLDNELEQTLNNLFAEAREQRHEFMTVEHLLFALLNNNSAASVLKACGANLNVLHNNLIKFIQENSVIVNDIDERDTQPTIGFQRVLQRAVFNVQSSGKQEVNGSNVLVAIFGERDSQAVYFLHQQTFRDSHTQKKTCSITWIDTTMSQTTKIGLIGISLTKLYKV